MKNSKKMRINKIISKQKSKKSKNNLRKKHITNKNNYRNKKRINKSIKYGGMEATNSTSNIEIITIYVKMDDEIITIMVNKKDNINNSIKEALIDKFPANIPLRISFGDDVVNDDDDNTFESVGIEENCTLSVKPVDFLALRWANCDISLEEYIGKIKIVGWKYQILTQLLKAINEPNPLILSRGLEQKIIELIERLTPQLERNASICDIQRELLKHNVILPSDEIIKNIDKLAELYNNADPDDTQNETNIETLENKIHELEKEDLERLGY